jgi:hypothetical protein
MSLDIETDALFDQCDTYDQLREKLGRLLESRGMPGEKWFDLKFRALIGGTTVYRNENGAIINKWRRKFCYRDTTELERAEV